MCITGSCYPSYFKGKKQLLKTEKTKIIERAKNYAEYVNKTGKKVYLSGAIMNDPNHKLNFENCERILTDKGFMVLSPIRTTAYTFQKSVKECLIDALKLLIQADVMIPISDPAISEGMRIEMKIARYLQIPIDKSLLDNPVKTEKE